MGLPQRFAGLVTDHSRLVLLGFVLATVVVGAAAGSVESDITIASFESTSTAAEKLDYVERNFVTEGQNTTAVQVVVRGEDVLDRESLLATLRLQQRLRANATVNGTLAPGRSTVGLANLVALAAMSVSGDPGAGGPGGAGPPPLSAQIDRLEALSAAELEAVVARVLDPERPASAGPDPYTLLPTSYEPGATTASGRILFVFQDSRGGSGTDLPPAVVDGQLAIQDVVAAELGPEAFTFGAGIVSEESTRATGESFAVIGPVALLLLLGILGVAYRDVLDVALGLVGVVLVLVWMAGVMGWAGIGVTQILIAVPFLLVGLSIDYALHVVMRYREADQGEAGDGDRPSPREAMRLGLGGVVVALGAATVTTSVGFLSNATSPIVSIREFGVVAAAGIVSAFVVFAVFLPALKVELEGLLRRVGLSREKRAFGRGRVAGRVLLAGHSLASRAPVAVIVIALVLAAGGGVAATDIETSIEQVEFLPRDSPEWMEVLPAGLQPGDYAIREHAVYLNDQFVQARGQSEAILLVEGPITDPGTLDRLAAGQRALATKSTPVRLATGDLETTGPLETVQSLAQRSEGVAAVLESADTDGDGVPDRNLAAVYDAVYAAAPAEAAAVISRQDGEYRALRVAVAVGGGSDTGVVTAEMREVAEAVAGDSDLTVTATGQPVVQNVVQADLLRTLVQGFLLTLGVIVVFLSAIFWRRYGAPSLGPVVILPVVSALGWILGTMYLAGIPFNSETAIIAGIAIGIGVDYAIHIGERFLEERGATGDPDLALRRTVRGTGGALLASAVSTASGFGVLMLALVPSLQRFGFVTAVAIAYAFLASVLMLPGLLFLWDRWADLDLGPDAGDGSGREAATAAGGRSQGEA